MNANITPDPRFLALFCGLSSLASLPLLLVVPYPFQRVCVWLLELLGQLNCVSSSVDLFIAVRRLVTCGSLLLRGTAPVRNQRNCMMHLRRLILWDMVHEADG